MLGTTITNKPKSLALRIGNQPIALAVGLGVVAIAVIAILMLNVMDVDAATIIEQDPTGDAVLESGSTPPGYLDVERVKISEENGSDEIVFSVDLAGEVPSSFGADDYYEVAGLSLNLQPEGGAQYVVIVRWSEGAFEGVLIDWSNGFPPSNTPIKYDISGSTVTATVPSKALGNPESLTWLSMSREKAFVRDNPLEGVTDVVPNDFVTIPWVPGDATFPENVGVWTSND